MDSQAQAVTPAEVPSYTRLTKKEREQVMSLRDGGMSYEAIAEHVNRSISTVYEVVQEFTPKLDLAKRRYDAAVLDMLENVIENGSTQDHTKLVMAKLAQETESRTLKIEINGLDIYGTGRPEAIEGQVLSPLQLEGRSEGQQNR